MTHGNIIKSTHHTQFFSPQYFLTQLEVCGHIHRFLYRQVRMQLIILHDVSGQFAEQANIPFLSVHGDRPFNLLCPEKS